MGFGCGIWVVVVVCIIIYGFVRVWCVVFVVVFVIVLGVFVFGVSGVESGIVGEFLGSFYDVF